jgi:hypothetical protein
MHPSVGIFFSAVALLQISGDTSKKLLLPNSNHPAFVEGKERLHFKSYFAAHVSSRKRRIDLINQLKEELEMAASADAKK